MKKRKAEVMVEAPDKKKKFVFNKRGKLKEDELKELSRTNKNIFSWLKPKSKPTQTPVYMLANVMEVEVEDMDVVDTVQEERLERVRIRQLEWACQMLCKVLVSEMVDTAVMVSERTVCEYWVETVLIDKCWSTLE